MRRALEIFETGARIAGVGCARNWSLEKSRTLGINVMKGGTR